MSIIWRNKIKYFQCKEKHSIAAHLCVFAALAGVPQLSVKEFLYTMKRDCLLTGPVALEVVPGHNSYENLCTLSSFPPRQ